MVKPVSGTPAWAAGGAGTSNTSADAETVNNSGTKAAINALISTLHRLNMIKSRTMFRPFPLFVGFRYLRNRRRNHFASFITVVSTLGIALGCTVLITVLSVMNGFETQLRDRILGMTAHAVVLPFSEMMDDWPQVQSQIANKPQVTGSAPFIEGEGMLRNGSLFSGVQIRGVDPEQELNVSRVGEFMQENTLDSLEPGEFGIVLGDKLAEALAAGVGEKVDLMIPKASLTPAGVVPRFRRFKVVGIFSADMYEYDRSLALVHLSDAQRLYRAGSQVTGLRLQFDDMFAAPRLRQEIEMSLDGPWFVSDWTRQHRNFFQAIATEKTVMFMILLLIIAVAAFNIVSALVMVVTDKQGDIAVLRTLGATPKTIMGIFMIQGFVIGAFGTILGVAGGVALASNIDVVVPWIEQLAGRDLLSSDVYVISDLNGELHSADVWRTAIMAFVLSWLSTLYPAWKASRIQPAEALRYE